MPRVSLHNTGEVSVDGQTIGRYSRSSLAPGSAVAAGWEFTPNVGYGYQPFMTHRKIDVHRLVDEQVKRMTVAKAILAVEGKS